jgi:hypothetical protein
MRQRFDVMGKNQNFLKLSVAYVYVGFRQNLLRDITKSHVLLQHTAKRSIC